MEKNLTAIPSYRIPAKYEVEPTFQLKKRFDPNSSTQIISYKDQHYLLWYVCNVGKIFNISYAP